MTPLGHRRLILTRHAKSAWDDPTLADHDRPLNARGRRSALALGDWLASRGYEPEEVLCSSARRTQETWAMVAAAPVEVRPLLRIEPGLYHASPDKMLTILRMNRKFMQFMRTNYNHLTNGHFGFTVVSDDPMVVD